MSPKITMTHEQHKINFIFEQNKVKKISIDSSASFELLSEDTALSRCLNEFKHLVGLDRIKDFFYELYAWLEINKQREAMGLVVDPQVLHMVFTGNPGTGKTTIARIASKFFKDMGILEKGHLIEVDRADLVGEYIGHTAQKTKELINKAIGGVLFIDEAYALSRGGEKDFGKEAIDTLVKAMEDRRSEFILILAGYTHEMNSFLNANSGISSRLPNQLLFPDFSVDELIAITENMINKRDYTISDKASVDLRNYLQDQKLNYNPNLGNAIFIRNLVEKAIRKQSIRMLSIQNLTREELMTLRQEDFQLE